LCTIQLSLNRVDHLARLLDVVLQLVSLIEKKTPPVLVQYIHFLRLGKSKIFQNLHFLLPLFERKLLTEHFHLRQLLVTQ